MNSETGTSLKLRVLNLPKRELLRDLTRAVEFDQSQLFKQIYENEFGTPGGEPYGALIGDYEWTNHPDDIETLRLVSNVAAGAFAPFISGRRRQHVRLPELDRAVAAARPREDLRHASNTRSGAASATARIRASSTSSCRASSRGCPMARRPSRSTNSPTRKRRLTPPARRGRWTTSSIAG